MSYNSGCSIREIRVKIKPVWTNRKTWRRQLALAALAVCTSILSSTPICAKQSPVDPQLVTILTTLNAQPELMDPRYLQLIIGMPENWRSQEGLSHRNYYWYQEPGRQLLFHLEQDGASPALVTQSSFSATLPDSQLKTSELAGLAKRFGSFSHRSFDSQAQPVDYYRTGPNTYMAFTQPRDTFRVSSIRVGYAGPGLQPPSHQAIASLEKVRAEIAMKAQNKGEWHKAIPWLESEARHDPTNPLTHMRLAEAYRNHLMLNQSIREYHTALRLSGGEPSVVKACRAALIDMKVLPHSDSTQYSPPSGGSYLAGMGGGL